MHYIMLPSIPLGVRGVTPQCDNGCDRHAMRKDVGFYLCRFNHEAAAVDPSTGYVYLTEDRGDSLFYRFVPNQPNNLSAGGILYALKILNSLAPEYYCRQFDD
jgi:hypothetical protein